MVKTIFVASFLFLLAIPALAQDDFPRIQQGIGYSNIGVSIPNGDGTSTTSRHSGFAMQTDLNLTRMFGIENYLGYYGLSTPTCGSSSCYAFTEMIGGRVNYRMDRLIPYAVAAIGTGSFSEVQGQNSLLTGPFLVSSSMATARLGVGVDIPMNDLLYLKVDVSRTSLHMTDFSSCIVTGDVCPASWNSHINLTVGVVFNLLMN